MQSPIYHPELDSCGMISIPPMEARCTGTRRHGAVRRVQYDEIYFYRHRDNRRITADGQPGQVLSSVVVWYDANNNQVSDEWQITSNLMPEYTRDAAAYASAVDELRSILTISVA